MKDYRFAVEEAVTWIENRLTSVPTTGLILGTGLGSLAESIEIQEVIPYKEIPNFPSSTVESHAGRLLLGTVAGISVLILQGRFHLYEGYSARDVTFPIRVFGRLGVKTLFLSNAAGGLNPAYRRGDLMLISDHINLQGANPLEGQNEDSWGPRFPDMSAPYDPDLLELARSVALSESITLHEGVYVAVPGPNLETRAEYRMLRTLGADAVGMSSVPEVIVARHMSIRLMAISVITDECDPDNLNPVLLQEIIAAADSAGPALRRLFELCMIQTHSS